MENTHYVGNLYVVKFLKCRELCEIESWFQHFEFLIIFLRIDFCLILYDLRVN